MSKKSSLFTQRNLYMIFAVTLIGVMGVASITPAFPDIARHFSLNKSQIGWLITVFTLPGIFLMPVLGILADRFGRKVILVPSLFLFGIAGFACIFTDSYYWLLVFRFFQGVGASCFGLSLTLIGDLYSGEERIAVMGYNASVLSIGTAGYPALGGILASFGWHYVFALPIVSILIGIWIARGLKNPEPSEQVSLGDYFKRVWETINQREVWALFVLNIMLFVILYGAYLSYFPFLVEERLNLGSFEIGMIMSLMSVITAFVSSRLKQISRFLTPKMMLSFSVSMYFFSMLLMINAHNLLIILISVSVFGVGHGVFIPSVQNLLLGYSSIKERAAFMSISSMVLRIGQTIGPLIIGIFFAIGKLKGAFLSGAIVAVIMLVIILLWIHSGRKSNP